mgnify:CR=1 FL=1
MKKEKKCDRCGMKENVVKKGHFYPCFIKVVGKKIPPNQVDQKHNFI